MRYFALSWALLLLGVTLVFGQVPITGAGRSSPAGGGGGASFTGPIDINGTAYAFWSMRPGSGALAAAGQKLFNVCDSATGSTCGDATATAAGGVTLPGSPSCGSCEIAIIYDQSGSSNCSGPCDVSIAHGNRPSLTVSCQNSLPCAVFTLASNNCMKSAANATSHSQPIFVSIVALITNGAGHEQEIWAQGSQNYAGVDNASTFWLDLSFSATVTDNQFNAVQSLFSGSSSAIYVAGSNTAGNAGANGINNAEFDIGGRSSCSAATAIGGEWLETGMWNSDQSGNNATLNTNQHNYWSF